MMTRGEVGGQNERKVDYVILEWAHWSDTMGLFIHSALRRHSIRYVALFCFRCPDISCGPRCCLGHVYRNSRQWYALHCRFRRIPTEWRCLGRPLSHVRFIRENWSTESDSYGYCARLFVVLRCGLGRSSDWHYLRCYCLFHDEIHGTYASAWTFDHPGLCLFGLFNIGNGVCVGHFSVSDRKHLKHSENADVTIALFSITFCGMVMKQYVSFNISKKSDATTEYVLKMLSSIMETIIFMFMGLSTVSDSHSWNTGFVLITVVSCLVFRFIGKSPLVEPWLDTIFRHV